MKFSNVIVFAVMLLVIFPVIAFARPPKKRVVGHKVKRIPVRMIHCLIETPGLHPVTAGGYRLSTRLAASNFLPIGAKVYASYRVKRHQRWIKKTRCWRVGDKIGTSLSGVIVEPYIRTSDESWFNEHFEGRRTVTVITPIYR